MPWPHQALERPLLMKPVAMEHAGIPGAAGVTVPRVTPMHSDKAWPRAGPCVLAADAPISAVPWDSIPETGQPCEGQACLLMLYFSLEKAQTWSTAILSAQGM